MESRLLRSPFPKPLRHAPCAGWKPQKNTRRATCWNTCAARIAWGLKAFGAVVAAAENVLRLISIRIYACKDTPCRRRKQEKPPLFLRKRAFPFPRCLFSGRYDGLSGRKTGLGLAGLRKRPRKKPGGAAHSTFTTASDETCAAPPGLAEGWNITRTQAACPPCLCLGTRGSRGTECAKVRKCKCLRGR